MKFCLKFILLLILFISLFKVADATVITLNLTSNNEKDFSRNQHFGFNNDNNHDVFFEKTFLPYTINASCISVTINNLNCEGPSQCITFINTLSNYYNQMCLWLEYESGTSGTWVF